MKKVIVLMSSYNGELYIQDQIRSILNQKNCIVELIIRDDGSSDNTQSILIDYQNKYSNITIYLGKENMGPAKSFMWLLKNAPEADYYAFSDQDDVWYPNKLERAISMMNKTEQQISLYYSNADLVDSNLKSLNKKTYQYSQNPSFKDVIVSGRILGCTMVITKDLAHIIQTKEIPNKIIMHDYYIGCVCSTLEKGIIFDEKSSLMYRQHGNNVVGVRTSFYDKILSFIKDIKKKNNVSISDQCKEIVIRYDEKISLDKKQFLNKVVHYKDNFFKQLIFAFLIKIHQCSFKQKIRLHLMYLLGKR